jgi:predicted MPP superfamily phosphohydrolase
MSRFVTGLYSMPLMKKMNSSSSECESEFINANRGLGTLGFPVRVGAHEIALLTLRSQG